MKGYINFRYYNIFKVHVLAGSEQTTEYAPFDESGNILQDSNLAESSSVVPIEYVSEDFFQNDRGQDVIQSPRR